MEDTGGFEVGYLGEDCVLSGLTKGMLYLFVICYLLM